MERAIYASLMLSYLHGMAHILEKFEAREILNFSDYLIPEEAIEFLRQRISMSKEEFYKLDAKARFRAFTVALLTGLDAIEKVKEKLLKALEEGKTLKEFIEELGHEEVIQKAGFSKTNPWYWETVFRTNLHSAYNAGRIAQIKRLGEKVKYLRYVAIDDNRTTEICKRLNGTTLPADDPFWETRIPPNHFRCRSTVVPIFKGEEAKPTPKPKVKPPEGFDTSPLSSWWKPSQSMARRIVEYGYGDLVEEKAKKLLCKKEFSDECREFEEVRKSLKVWKEQKEIEERFLKRVESLKWNTKEEALESFKNLWVNERNYKEHISTRLKYGQIIDEFDYLLKTFKALTNATKILIMKPKSESVWTRVYYVENLSWCVILSEEGIITSFKVEKEWFKDRLKVYRDELGYEVYSGYQNENLKRVFKRIYDVCRNFRERS